MSNNYNPLLVSVVDHARYHIGDKAEPWLLADETISSMIGTYGWARGMANLVNGLLTEAGQEPIKMDEGNGLMVDMSGRLKEWRRLLDALLAGQIPDPIISTPSTNQEQVFSSVSLATEFTW